MLLGEGGTEPDKRVNQLRLLRGDRTEAERLGVHSGRKQRHDGKNLH